jgi:hypothetical protein
MALNQCKFCKHVQFPTTGNSGRSQMKIDMKTCVNVLQDNQTVNSM